MALFDYTCRFGHVTERVRRPGVQAIICPACGHTALRSRVNRPALVSGATRTWQTGMPETWQEAHERAQTGFKQIAS